MPELHQRPITGTRIQASDTRPFKPYVYRGETEEPPAVIAARERWRALEESMPDMRPDPEWYRELDDETPAPASVLVAVPDLVPEPEPEPQTAKPTAPPPHGSGRLVRAVRLPDRRDRPPDHLRRPARTSTSPSGPLRHVRVPDHDHRAPGDLR